MRKEYKTPKVVSLGSAAAATKSNNAPNSDVEPFQDDTAVPPPPPNGSTS